MPDARTGPLHGADGRLLPDAPDRLPPDAAAPPIATPDLQRHRDAYRAVSADVELLLQGIDDRQYNWRPAPGRWSIAECLSHLEASLALYLPEIDRAIRRGRERGMLRAGTGYRYGRLEWGWARSLEPPPTRRYPAPRSMAPSASAIALEPGRRAFLAANASIIERVEAADGLDLRRVKVRLPAFKLVRLSLGAVFELHGTHARRHLWQAGQVRSSADFPAGA